MKTLTVSALVILSLLAFVVAPAAATHPLVIAFRADLDGDGEREAVAQTVDHRWPREQVFRSSDSDGDGDADFLETRGQPQFPCNLDSDGVKEAIVEDGRLASTWLTGSLTPGGPLALVVVQVPVLGCAADPVNPGHEILYVCAPLLNPIDVDGDGVLDIISLCV